MQAKRNTIMLLGALAALAVAGCGGGGGGGGGPTDPGRGNPFAGSYTGTYTGTENGYWTAQIHSDGTLTATITSPSVGTFTGTGTVTDTGEMEVTLHGSGQAGSLTITYTGKFYFDGGKVKGAGTWQSTSGYHGTWKTTDGSGGGGGQSAFSCKIDGQTFRPSLAFFELENGSLCIMGVSREGGAITIALYEIGAAPLTASLGSGWPAFGWCFPGPDPETAYSTWHDSGTCHVEVLTADRCAGTFSFKARHESGPEVNVTEGSFDLTLGFQDVY